MFFQQLDCEALLITGVDIPAITPQQSLPQMMGSIGTVHNELLINFAGYVNIVMS